MDTVAYKPLSAKDVNWKKILVKLLIKSVISAIVKIVIAKLLFDKIK